MIKFKSIEKKEEWDGFVISCDRYTFIQSWNYLNVLEVMHPMIKRVGVYEDNELIGLLPCSIIHAKRGDYLRLRHGPILNARGWEKFAEIIKYLEKISKENGLSFVRIQPVMNYSDKLVTNGFKKAPTHNLDAENTLQLALKDRNEEELLKNMRKNTRYYIRKAFKEGVEVVKERDFESFYEILMNTSIRQDYTAWPKKYFEAIFENFSKELTLYFAVVDGKKVGIGLFIDFGKYRFYTEGGMLVEYGKKYPSYAIQWDSIREAMGKGLEVYDFWGGVSPKDEKGNSVDNYPWAGIDLFKRGFGGEEVSIVHPHDLVLNWKYWITYIFEMIEKKRRGY